MQATNKQVPIKAGKVAPHSLSRNSKRKQKLVAASLAKGSNLSGGERHYDDQGDAAVKPKCERVEVGGYDNATLLLLADAGIKLIDTESAMGSYGLRMGKVSYLKPILDRAQVSTTEVDHTEPDTVRPKAAQLSEKVDRAGSKSARRSTGKALDPIHNRHDNTTPSGLFRNADGVLEGVGFEEALANKPFKMPRYQPNLPRGERHTIPMDVNGLLYSDPVRLKLGDTMVEDFDKRNRPTGYESAGYEYQQDPKTGKVELKLKKRK
jgi:hypothetical protein